MTDEPSPWAGDSIPVSDGPAEIVWSVDAPDGVRPLDASSPDGPPPDVPAPLRRSRWTAILPTVLVSDEISGPCLGATPSPDGRTLASNPSQFGGERIFSGEFRTDSLDADAEELLFVTRTDGVATRVADELGELAAVGVVPVVG